MTTTPATIDLSRFIRAGDRIMVGQGTAEAPSLSAALLALGDDLPPCEIMVGPLFSRHFLDAPSHIRFCAYGAMGHGAALAQQGRLTLYPLHYSALNAAFVAGHLRADVVMLQCAEGPGGLHAVLAHDYLLAAARLARHVIVEINAQAPLCAGTSLPDDVMISARFHTDTPMLTLAPASPGAIDRRIAEGVSAEIGDGATLQVGIGAIPDAVLAQLEDRRDLGLHTGLVSDSVVSLIESGAMTNALKGEDRGRAVSNTAFGSESLHRFVHQNAAFVLRPASISHGQRAMAALPDFVAVNSALEVDLAGNINSERVDGRQVGGTGGLVDFLRGARASDSGKAIIALRSTDRTGAISRIVPKVAAVTASATDADIVVTEHGTARLRHLALPARARAMAAIAAPDHREELLRAIHAAGL